MTLIDGARQGFRVVVYVWVALHWVPLVLLLCAVATPADAQTTRGMFVEATGTTGNVVDDLKPADFQVMEGGEVREITSATLTRRPVRIVLIVDSTDAIRQPIGLIRTAVATLLGAIDAQHEMMFVTVAGTSQIRVQPTTDRQALIKAANGLFGTGGASTMHRHIDDIFHRFGQTSSHRPIFVVVTAEGFESTDNINPQQIKHLSDHFISRGGTLHGIRLIVPLTREVSGRLTELPVTQLIARDTGGVYTDISPNGLQDVLRRLAAVINDRYAASPMGYQIEYVTTPPKAKKPAAPDVRVSRAGVQLKIVSTP
jgi:hypothetical protein